MGWYCSTYIIIAVVFCVVNIVTVWSFPHCLNQQFRARSFDCQINYFPVNCLQLHQKLHYIGNDQEKPQEDMVRLMRQLLCSSSGDKRHRSRNASSSAIRH